MVSILITEVIVKKKKSTAKTEAEVFVKLYLPDSVHRQVKSAAALDGVKIGDKVVDLVRRGLRK